MMRNGRFLPPYEEFTFEGEDLGEVALYFTPYGLDPGRAVDRSIASIVWDLADRRGCLPDDVRDDREVMDELVATWRAILSEPDGAA